MMDIRDTMAKAAWIGSGGLPRIWDDNVGRADLRRNMPLFEQINGIYRQVDAQLAALKAAGVLMETPDRAADALAVLRRVASVWLLEDEPVMDDEPLSEGAEEICIDRDLIRAARRVVGRPEALEQSPGPRL